MSEKWKGSYTIETVLVLGLLSGLIFWMLTVGVYWYNRCVVEGRAAVWSMTEKEQELPGILFFDETIIFEKKEDTVSYSVSISGIGKKKLKKTGEKEALHEVSLMDIRTWKYIKGSENED